MRQDGIRYFSWGFISQGLSSATNLALSVIAARVLGPSGLGVIAIAFGSYVAALGIQRALVCEPLVALTVGLPVGARVQATRKALTIALMLAIASAAIVAAAGITVRGEIGSSLVIVAPWLPVLVIQDFWRAVLFRDGRPRACAANDATWLLVMGAAAPFAWVIGSVWAVVACWALGGLAGALLGFYQSSVRTEHLQAAFRWWRQESWALGRWLGANSLVEAICGYALLFLLAAVVGTSALGGLKAVTTIFTPLSVIGPAIALPGLPALARLRLASERAALRLAVRLGLISVGLTGIYVGLLSIGGGSVVARLFGHSFDRFTGLVWPVSVGQMITASALGLVLLLKAQRRGKAVLLSDGAGWAVGLGGAVAFGAIDGVTGAAWGLACGHLVATGTQTVLVLRPPRDPLVYAAVTRTAASTGFNL